MWIDRTVKISEKEDVMSSNQDKIIEKYKSGFEDRRAELSRAGKMEFHYTEKLLRRYMKGLPRTIELGCAPVLPGFQTGFTTALPLLRAASILQTATCVPNLP